MAEGVVESKEEMKRKMEKKKEQEKKDVIKIQPKQIKTPPKADEPKKTEEVKEKLSTAKEDTKVKLTGAKQETEQKLAGAKQETEEKLGSAKEKLSETHAETKQKLTTAKEDTKVKLTGAKQETEEKLGSAKEKLSETQAETKQKLSSAKEDTEQKFTDVKEDAKDRWGNVQDNIGDFRDEAAARLEQYRKESEEEGRNPAEKFVSDLFAGIRQKTEEANQAVMEKTGVLAINFPLTDVIENPTSITIISDIPGLTKEDIDVGISQTTVEISATYDKEPTEPDSQFLQKERGYGKVSRIIELPATIDIEKTTANYKNNVLTIVLPKKERDVTKVVIKE